MSIEENIFLKTNVDFDKLLEYGFIKKDDIYLYSKNIIDDTFKVIVEINKDQIIKGKVIELAFKDEYTNFRINNSMGEFTSKVREEFENILKDIKESCFTKEYFISKQANRIADLVWGKFHNKPEFLWKNDSTSGVFRNSNNSKWYGIIMYIPKYKIDTGSDKVEIINVKVNAKYINDILLKKGFYKAYHMNKKNWVSIILDNSVDDKVIMKYIKESYSLTDK